MLGMKRSSGENASRAVPVHVVTSDPAVLARFLEWGFAEGVEPPETPESDVPRMSTFREWFIRSFSTASVLTQ